jgi:hypothetical protein
MGSSFHVLAGLDPAIHVDPRVKPGGDGKGEQLQFRGMRSNRSSVCRLARVARE